MNTHSSFHGQMSPGTRRTRAMASADNGFGSLIGHGPQGFQSFDSSLHGGNSYVGPGFAHSHTDFAHGHSHGQQQYNEPQSRQQDNTSTHSNNFNADSASGPQQDFSWTTFIDEIALNASGVTTRETTKDGKHDQGKDDGDVDDAASTCDSACEGSCPSQCGDVGHGVCCDDDECSVVPDLCVDDACGAAVEPCTDEACPVKTVEAKRTPGSTIAETDKAAAVVLASFGDGNIQAQAGQNQFSQSSALAQHITRDGSLDHMGLAGNPPCGDFPMDPMFTNIPDFSDQSSIEAAFQFALANHLLQYHNPYQNQTEFRPCVADDPSRFGPRCLLPKYPANGMDNDTFMSDLQGHECGFQVSDPGDFTHHIFEEHRWALMPPSQQFETPSPHAHCHDGLNHTHTHSHSHGCFPASAYQMNMNLHGSRPFSSASTPTIVSSGQPSLSTTPTSPLGSEQLLTAPSSTGKTQSPPSLPQTQTFDSADQHICRWRLGGDAVCGKSFNSDDELHAHCKLDHLKLMQKVPGGFACQWDCCGRERFFSQRSKLERHLQVHTGYKPVQCSICGASLSAKQSLDQHMRIHTGSKPWVCSFPGCGLTFKQQSALTMHERTHTGEKPLECEICGKRFSESSNLSKHRRIHNVKGMHECDICGKDFHRLDQLRRHIGTKHKDKSEEVDELLARARAKSQGAARISKLQRTKAPTVNKRNLDAVGAMAQQMEMML